MNLSDAAELARTIMTERGLFERGWKFMFSSENKVFGRCKYSQKVITLSTNLTLLNNETEVRDTILHEVAHAETPGHGHDKIWKAKCVEIGARPERLYDAAKVVLPKSRYEVFCPTCGNTWPRRRNTKKRVACGRCCKLHNNGKFDERFICEVRKVKLELAEVTEDAS